MQKTLIVIGSLILLTGLLWPFIQKMGLGKLPGDIRVEKENMNFYFPIVTCIILSILINLILRFFNK